MGASIPVALPPWSRGAVGGVVTGGTEGDLH